MTLTKEQIEGFFALVQVAVDYHDKGAKTPATASEVATFDECFSTVKSLALLAVALKPRPLAEIENSNVLVIWEGYDGKRFSLAAKYPSGEWKGSVLDTAWPNTTLAIPLSALSSLMEGK